MPQQFTETDLKQIFKHFQIPVPFGKEVSSVDEARNFVYELGFPLVVKISHPEVHHKTEIKGVATDIYDVHTMTLHTQRLLDLKPGAKVRIEKQGNHDGLDLIIGFKQDPIFGPIYMLGLGGIYTEIFNQKSIYLGQLTEKSANQMIENMPGVDILKGARSKTPFDRDFLVQILTIFSSIPLTYPILEDLEINPFRLYEQGGQALDAMGICSDKPHSFNSKSFPCAYDRIHKIFYPKSAAIVGASTHAEKAGNIIIKNLKTFNYKGKIYPVNPSGNMIEGLNSYSTLSQCPENVDIAVLAIPGHTVEHVIEDIASSHINHAIILSGGFSDAGENGKQLEQKILNQCHMHGIHVMGPNSIGVVNTDNGFCTSIGKLPPMKKTGISIMGQTGTFSTGYALEESTVRGSGFSKIACLGNKGDLNECDFLDYLANDPQTRCIGMYIESVHDGQRFIHVAQEATRKKPVIVLKSGRTPSGKQAASSHTGALAGSDDIFDALFHQTGIQRVYNLIDFFNILRAFDLCPLPQGNHIGIVSITGIGCVLSADACDTYGMSLSSLSQKTQSQLQQLVPDWALIGNPADIWSTIEQRGPFKAFQKMSEIMLSDPDVHCLIVISVLLDEGIFDAANAFSQIRKQYPNKPIIACYLGGWKHHIESFYNQLSSIDIPVYNSPESAIQAASYLYKRSLIESSNLC